MISGAHSQEALTSPQHRMGRNLASCRISHRERVQKRGGVLGSGLLRQDDPARSQRRSSDARGIERHQIPHRRARLKMAATPRVAAIVR